MNSSTDVIGQTCDHGNCSAPHRVLVEFTHGELAMCHHHWRSSEDQIVQLPTFVRVMVDDPMPLAAGV